MGGLKEDLGLWARNAELSPYIKHPECVDRVVVELQNGSVVEAGPTRPKDAVAYIIEYKQGPCTELCQVLDPDIQMHGCYNGRRTRIPIEEMDSLKHIY